MHPSYPGRSPLPAIHLNQGGFIDFSLPDRVKIAIIRLAFEGIAEAEKLGPMVQNVFKTAENELSKQTHYDFGLRALLAVFRSAGKERRFNPSDDIDEAKLVADSIRSYNSRYTREDTVKFEEIMAKHGFPKASPDDTHLYETFK
jgi:dynein heavy chain